MQFKNNIFNEYSAKIGSNSLLIQGAGGNISCKDKDTLWIKASGTQLAKAQTENIFLPLSLSKTRVLITSGESDYSKAKLTDTPLRPSIETPLHALFSHKIVIHVHSVDVISVAILKNAQKKLKLCLADLNWGWIPYVKPGPALAEAILHAFPDNIPHILVLGNHGLVIAANSLEEADLILNSVLERLQINIKSFESLNDTAHFKENWIAYGYQQANASLQFLAHDYFSLQLIEKKWVLYPDHAVFLGGIPPLILPEEKLTAFFKRIGNYPPLVVVPHEGVLIKNDIKEDCLAMLICYAAILQRIQVYDDVVALSQKAIIELLHWDAEKYRQSMPR